MARKKPSQLNAMNAECRLKKLQSLTGIYMSANISSGKTNPKQTNIIFLNKRTLVHVSLSVMCKAHLFAFPQCLLSRYKQVRLCILKFPLCFSFSDAFLCNFLMLFLDGTTCSRAQYRYILSSYRPLCKEVTNSPADKWLRYCLYGEIPTNQSTNLSIFSIFFYKCTCKYTRSRLLDAEGFLWLFHHLSYTMTANMKQFFEFHIFTNLVKL